MYKDYNKIFILKKFKKFKSFAQNKVLENNSGNNF